MSLKTKMLHYQEEAFNKLKQLKVGALFMEMGTGKTRTALEIVNYRFVSKKIDKVIWFTPVSIKKNLEQDINKHSKFSVFSIEGKTLEGTEINSDIIVCGIQSTSSSNRVLAILDKIITDKTMIIVDESTYIKNPLATRSKWITHFSEKVKYKLILNGTPTTNSVSDLYQQFKFLSPKILGYNSFYSFAKNHLEYDKEFPNKVVKSHNLDYITSKIAPYTFQINKSDAVKLPEKIRIHKYGELTNLQEDYYFRAKEEFIENIEKKGFVAEGDVYRMFTKLQQISSGIIANKGKVIKIKHNKSDILKHSLEECIGKTIIFHKYVNETEDILKVTGNEDTVVITSSMNEKTRNRNIEKFKNSKKYLIMNLGIGSFGYNLVEAKNIVYYSNKFNFAERLQSEDRIHRIGQKDDVTYIDICVSKFEKKILDSLEKKESLLKTITSELRTKNNSSLKEL